MGLPEVVRSAQYFFRLFDSVLRLTRYEQGGQGNVFVVVLVARES
jgi:hypothetical protein